MEALGWENAFFSMNFPKNEPTDWSRYFVDEIQIGHKYSLWEKCTKATKVIYSFEAQRNLRRLIEDYKPDISHIHNIYHHLSPSVLPVLKESGIPVVMTAHDLKIACPNNKMLASDGICERCKPGRFYNAAIHRCIHGQAIASSIIALESYLHRWLDSYKANVDVMVVPSRFFISKFVAWGWPESLFTYIPNFVDARSFQPQFRAGAEFTFFGRLSMEKGVATLIRAAKAAGTRIRLVGTGPIEEDLKKLAYSIDAPVDFLGYRSGRELFDLVRSSRATVLPSEWYENAPISVLESMALGTPVIGARIGGIPEMVIDGQTGWLFESGDEGQLASVLRVVAESSDDVVENIGRNARSVVEETYSPTRYADAVRGVYSKLGVA